MWPKLWISKHAAQMKTKAKFDFSRPRRVSLIMQAKSQDGVNWQEPKVAFVVDSVNADVVDAALNEEVAAHVDWTLEESSPNERVLKFSGVLPEYRFKKLFADETTNYLTK